MTFLATEVQQDSYGNEKSWNLKMHSPGLEKSWILGKMLEVTESQGISIFGSKYFMLFENWKHCPCQLCPQNAWFSAFLGHAKFKLVMEKSLKLIAQFLHEPCTSF